MFKFVFYKTSFLHPHKHMKQTHTPSHPRNKLGEDSTLILTEQHALCTTEENLLAFWSEWRIGRKEEERERERETNWLRRIWSYPVVCRKLYVQNSICRAAALCSLLQLLFMFITQAVIFVLLLYNLSLALIIPAHLGNISDVFLCVNHTSCH